jgi:predicted nucleic acid-binding protein
LQQLESWVEPIPFDGDCARAYGRIYAAALAAGRQPRRRSADLLIAATALAAGMPLYTRNGGDFAGLEQLLTVVAV